jgi:predicted transcriptional regulator
MEKNEIIQTVNTKTGEIKDGYFVYVAYPKPKIRNTRWMMTFQDSLEIIATDSDITGQTLKVMLLLMANLEFENYIPIRQVTIAQKLKIDKADVSKAIKLLVNKEIILKVKEGTTTGYRLNPNYGWKGKVENMEKVKARIAEDKIIDFQSARESRDASDVGIHAEDIPY